ncbi:MAG: DNA recombination protein RmuC [Microbacteriaceae bacterium]
MDPILALLLGLVVGVAIGGVIGLLVARTRRAGQAVDLDPAVLQARHDVAVAELRSAEGAARAEIAMQLAAAQASLAGLREQLEAAHEQYRELDDRVRRDAAERAAAAQSESKVLQALTPVQESLRTMQATVTELEAQRSQQHGELAQQLKTSAESEERLRATAESLASALKNNSTRGVWGETQLRAVVESAGMLEHVNFDVQSGIRVESRSARPDMIVHLPGGKSIAVDAKVPFTSYLEANSILPTASDAELARRDALLKQHVKAVRDHIVTLGGRSYWEGLDSSPEMVVAFIPSESLLSAALEADPSIMEFAFSKHVALASPVTLFSVLKAVAVSWRHEVVTQEAKALFDVSRELYGRLTTLASHVDKLGRSIERSVKDYNTFVGSLERQVLPSARRLSQLDESKVLPALSEIDEDTREVSSSDLTGVIEAELAALDQLQTGRAELDLGLATPPERSRRKRDIAG